jgi:hypothetical protein
MSCQACFNLEPEASSFLPPDLKAMISLQVSELINSVDNTACQECKLILNVLSTGWPSWLNEIEPSAMITLILARGRPLQVYSQGNTGLLKVSDSEITNENATASLKDTIGRGPEISDASDSRQSLDLIKRWHAECVTKHGLCKSTPRQILPLRLLRVSSKGVVLIEPRARASKRYVALSYCWGVGKTLPKFCTRSSNIQIHQSGIEINSLPVALQDAVSLTRELGYSYIWIDSLCIVQDDVDEWAREAARMCDIYSGAAMTIVGSRSHSVYSSLFGHHSYSDYNLVKYKDRVLRVTEDAQHNHGGHPMFPMDKIRDIDPVFTRAWTMQETALSNRAIYLSSDEMRWECNTDSRCQCAQASIDKSLKHDAEEWKKGRAIDYKIWRLDDYFPDSIQQVYSGWDNLVRSYTSRALTHEADRLAALSGLAARFQDSIRRKFNNQEMYLAGLWKGALPQQLLWTVSQSWKRMDADKAHEQPKRWRAPSWSWACLEAAVIIPFSPRLESRLKYLKSEIQLVTSNPFGQLKSADLHLRAPLLRNVMLILDTTPHGKVTPLRYCTARWQGMDLCIDSSYFDKSLAMETIDAFAAPFNDIALLIVGFEVDQYQSLAQSLAVVPVQGKPHTFERVGTVSLGQHMREQPPPLAATVPHQLNMIQNAPVQDIVLV